MILNVMSAVVEEAQFLVDDSAWDDIGVDLLQRASINRDGSSMISILETPR